ncbi:MAG TPA: ECF transporter S component [Candidatus Faeciplasma avium]|uniref:ECF transporter S component n=1 Tax=Candidatus Faeciplasma avium TaxID=2840798 RepID=A0A9D1NQR4_9FIRM|nr:ECF transporter S component [Candidatus Faeciplasma avium]
MSRIVSNDHTRIRTLTGTAMLTAIIIVLQLIGSYIKFGQFSISLVLIPIVLGAALFGVASGTWLGLAFGIVVLISGDAALFMTINPIGTVITVLLKGVLAGAASAAAYRLVEKKSRFAAVLLASFVCPVVNTGVFLLGCLVFFMDAIRDWAGDGNVLVYMIVYLVGINFVIELVINLVLNPAMVRLIEIGRKMGPEKGRKSNESAS